MKENLRWLKMLYGSYTKGIIMHLIGRVQRLVSKDSSATATSPSEKNLNRKGRRLIKHREIIRNYKR